MRAWLVSRLGGSRSRFGGPERSPLRALLVLAWCLLGVAAGAACRKPAERGEKRYALTGVVGSVNHAVREAVVAHDDIPGFMPAMTMPFPIDDDKVLATLKGGDQIAGTLVVGETRYRLEDVKVTREAPANLPPPASPAPGAEPDAGAEVPDVGLVKYSKSGRFDLFELATGEPDQIRRLASFLSLEYDEEAGGSFTHNLRTGVIGPDGQLFRLHRGNDWSAEALVGDLRASLGP